MAATENLLKTPIWAVQKEKEARVERLVSGNADRAVLGTLLLPAPTLLLPSWPHPDPMTSLPPQFPPGQVMTSRSEEEEGGGGMRWPGGWRAGWSGWRRS